MHDSITLANRFLDLAEAHGRALTPMQLLKLVYIAHGWSLGLYGRPLTQDAVEAWQYGPVIPRLYNAVRSFKSSPVRKPLPAPCTNEPLSPREISTIDQVYEIYGGQSGPALSRLTHAKGTPWDITYVPGEFGLEIPSDIIQDHYARLAARAEAVPA